MSREHPSASDVLGRTFDLPAGVRIKNRFLKSAMSEGLADRHHAPTERHARLYGTWADGGVGLSVTGNVMVDRRALGEPRNVVVEDERDLGALAAWAKAGTRNGTHLWMQLNHPGKQSPRLFSPETVAPSAIPFSPKLRRYFATPRALTEAEIEDLVARFARSAGVAKKAGFTGIQIHGAHGYLVNQFLSPLHNQREDRWGGSLENRMRFVLEVYRAIRAEVGRGFPVGIKLNSADFQRGGFAEEEALVVIEALAEAGVDLIEISGGNYESPRMTGQGVKQSTREREAYFLAFAEQVRARGRVPLAVTGGFRTHEGMADAVTSGAVDFVGLGRPMAIEPDLPNRILAGEPFRSRVRRLTTGFEKLDSVATLDVTWYEHQLARMGNGRPPRPTLGAWGSLMATVLKLGCQSFQVRRAS